MEYPLSPIFSTPQKQTKKSKHYPVVLQDLVKQQTTTTRTTPTSTTPTTTTTTTKPNTKDKGRVNGALRSLLCPKTRLLNQDFRPLPMRFNKNEKFCPLLDKMKLDEERKAESSHEMLGIS
mmetsp:Transcript_17839/g.37048  ORF Transcript_17839/g.37048 Transcript_17839/m.37048 type:complete len:121 (-) Transcript_17839:10-372(-)